MSSFIPTDCPFEILGYVEEFEWPGTGRGIGHRQIAEPDRPTGSPGRKEYTLTEPLQLFKGFRKIPITIKASRKNPVKVVASIQIICGRQKERQ